LETEINQSGEVVVEGHIIGRLQGFEFSADASGGGSDAKALRAAAQKALAGEIEKRADAIDQAGDDKIVLANDGLLRWNGEPVARLVAGEVALKPRTQLIADEQLTGPSRDKVAARIERWLDSHVEKLLGPLNALAKAEDVTGMARGVAFQLVESLGVLDRVSVADEVKGLDQEARAQLRKYGIRFGAYHIYVPALLKPAPRHLALLLWALKHGGLSQKGMSELPALASSGRTSIPNDKEIQKALYRAIGYRVAGTRAVRVDILERLADLIRPAIAWKPNAPGAKPQGAIDGFGFTVSVGMTSLVGCSGEDFASILRALGYRMDHRPAPVETPAPVPEPASSETAGAEESSQPVETPATPVEMEATPVEPVATPVETAAAAVEEAASGALSAPAVATGAEIDPVPETPAEAAPAMIEVWRPGRPRPERKPERKRPRREEAKPGEAVASSAGETKTDHVTERPRGPRPDKRGKDRNKDRGKNRERDATQFKPRPERREKPIDPNSPFASLMALKERLEAGNKDKG
jgi:ATP-dependent RNA helicase SUPV3L1/SUV3